MSIPQPIATDNLDAPDHSLLHRQIAADTAAPVKSLIADSAGKIGIGTETPAQQLDVAGSIQLSGSLTDGTNASTPANLKDAVDKKHAASGQFNQATAAEISGLTEKTTPVDTDVLLIEDSAASYAKKKILKSSLGPGGIPIATATGTADAITADYSPNIALTNLTMVAFVASAANATTTPTFAPDGLTAHTITKKGGAALAIDDIPNALAVCLVEYNSANTRWELLNPQPGIAFSGGVSWRLIKSAADINWRSVTYGGGLFVAVADSGTGNRVMTSPDGITWTTRTSAANISWRGVTYGGGLFVAVADSGTGNRVMTSPDGITWTIRTSAADNGWYRVTYGGGLFVAVAYTGTGNRVMTSPDGITWTTRTSAADNDWLSVTYGGGLFVAVANSGTGNRVMTSPDGITWTIRTSAADNDWYSVTYGGGLFVAVAYTGTGNRVMGG